MSSATLRRAFSSAAAAGGGKTNLRGLFPLSPLRRGVHSSRPQRRSAPAPSPPGVRPNEADVFLSTSNFPLPPGGMASLLLRSSITRCAISTAAGGGGVRRAISAAAAAGGGGVRGGHPFPILRVPARRIHDTGAESRGLVAPPHPQSEALAELDGLLEEVKAMKLDSLPSEMEAQIFLSIALVWREVLSQNIRRTWVVAAFLLAGYCAGYAMEEEKNRKRRKSMEN